MKKAIFLFSALILIACGKKEKVKAEKGGIEKPVAAKPAKPVAKQVEEEEDEMDLPF